MARLYCDWLYDRPPTNARISPRAGIDRDQRRFRLALPLPAREQLVHLGQPVAHRVLRQPLQVQVERRVDIDRLIRLSSSVRGTARRASARRSRRSRAPRPRARAERPAAVPAPRGRPRPAGRSPRPPSPGARRCAALCSGLVGERRQRRRRLDDARRSSPLRRASGSLTSLPKKSRAASGIPLMANDPRCPSGMSFRYSSRISSFDARCVRTIDTQISRSFRLGERARASCSDIPPNFGRNTLRTSCCVIVLPPARYVRRPVAYAEQRADHADRIDAGMLVEAAILDGEDGLHHTLGNRRERDRPRFSRSPVVERRQHRRIEVEPFARTRAELEADRRDPAGFGGGFRTGFLGSITG